MKTTALNGANKEDDNGDKKYDDWRWWRSPQ